MAMARMRSHLRGVRWPSFLTAIIAAIGLVTAAPGTAPAYADPADPAGSPVQAGIVQISTTLDYQNAIGTGTGIVISPSGEVLTNNHVVAGATSITATSVGTGRSYPVTVLGYDRKHDVALVQLGGAGGLPTAALGDSGSLTVGTPVVAIGNAGGTGSPLSQESGKVSALNQTVVASDDLTGSSEELNGLIQIAANLRPGDSGGPLVNGAGQVVGMNTAAAVNYDLGTPAGHGYAIPINQALAIASQIRSGAQGGSVHIGDTALLGVGVSNDRRSSGSGASVRQVLRGGPASQAGLAPGDTITAIDGNPVNSANALTDLLDQHHPGDSVTLTWIDGSGASKSAPVTLGSGPAG
jgi:serine protease Do